MTPPSQVARNTIWLTFAYILSRGLNLAIVALLSRYLGPAGYGELIFAYTYQGIFMAVADFGLESVLIRQCSLHPDRMGRIIGDAIWLKSLLALGSFVLCIALMLGLGYPPDKVLLVALASVTLFFSPLSLAAVVFAGTLRLDRQARLNMFEEGVRAALTLGALALAGSVTTIVLARLVALVVSTFAYLWGATRLCQLDLHPRPRQWRPLLRQALPMGFTTLVIILNQRLGHLVIEHRLGSTWLGLYAPGFQVYETVGMLVHFYFASAYPLLSQRWGESRAAFQQLYRRIFRYVPAVALLFALGITPLAGPFLRILGPDYLAGRGAFLILAWTIVFSYSGTVFYYTCLAAGQFSLIAWFSVLSLVLDTGLFLVLIPRYNINGAALSLLLAGVWRHLLLVILPSTRDYGRAWLRGLLWPLLAAGPAALLAFWAMDTLWGMLAPVLYVILVVLIALFRHGGGLRGTPNGEQAPAVELAEVSCPAWGREDVPLLQPGSNRYEFPVDLSDSFNSHALMIRLAGRDKRVLEVGCSSGFMSAYLIRHGCRVVGIELDPAAAGQARRRGVEVIEGDAEDPATQSQIEGLFDVVLLGDVLEHLRDPWNWLRLARQWLAPGGYVVLSVPNAGHWSFRREVLRGRFPYRPRGLFDRGHLRFFTLDTLREMVQQCGYRDELVAVTANSNTDDLTFSVLAPLYRSPATSPGLGWVERRLARHWPTMFGYQFVLRLYLVETC